MFLCLVFVMLSRLFIAALWSPRERADLLAVSLCFCSFSHGVLGQLWYLIVSIPELLLYFQYES